MNIKLGNIDLLGLLCKLEKYEQKFKDEILQAERLRIARALKEQNHLPELIAKVTKLEEEEVLEIETNYVKEVLNYNIMHGDKVS